MRILEEKFRSEFPQKKKNGFLIKIQIWFGFLNVGENRFFFFNENIKFSYEKIQIWFYTLKKNTNQVFVNKIRIRFYKQNTHQIL